MVKRTISFGFVLLWQKMKGFEKIRMTDRQLQEYVIGVNSEPRFFRLSSNQRINYSLFSTMVNHHRTAAVLPLFWAFILSGSPFPSIIRSSDNVTSARPIHRFSSEAFPRSLSGGSGRPSRLRRRKSRTRTLRSGNVIGSPFPENVHLICHCEDLAFASWTWTTRVPRPRPNRL